MKFEREAHRVVLEVLGLLRADVLQRCRFLFGGGTRIVLDLGEYRESKDIDFLCSDPQGYSDLRFDASRQGYPALFTAEGLTLLQFPRERENRDSIALSLADQLQSRVKSASPLGNPTSRAALAASLVVENFMTHDHDPVTK